MCCTDKWVHKKTSDVLYEFYKLKGNKEFPNGSETRLFYIINLYDLQRLNASSYIWIPHYTGQLTADTSSSTLKKATVSKTLSLCHPSHTDSFQLHWTLVFQGALAHQCCFVRGVIVALAINPGIVSFTNTPPPLQVNKWL